MIGFGELRRLSVQWHTDLAAVERLYALDWLLKGIFDSRVLSSSLTLRGASALSKAYFPSYPPIEDAEFVSDAAGEAWQDEMRQLGESATRASDIKFALHSIRGTQARFEYTGPLGRRSAAQPLIALGFIQAALRTEPTICPLLHPFSDPCPATVRAVALEELAAERIAAFGGKPRARDVFDLWFILTRGDKRLDRRKTRAMAADAAASNRHGLGTSLDSSYRPFLERAWNNALKSVSGHPSFESAVAEVQDKMTEILATAG